MHHRLTWRSGRINGMTFQRLWVLLLPVYAFFHQQLFDPNMLLIKNKSCLYIQISSHSSLNRKNWIFCVWHGQDSNRRQQDMVGRAAPFSTESIHQSYVLYLDLMFVLTLTYKHMSSARITVSLFIVRWSCPRPHPGKLCYLSSLNSIK